MFGRAQPPQPRTVLVTGATDGIGLTLARSYAARGHRVLATGRRVLRDPAELFGEGTAIVYIRADQQEPARAARQLDETLTTLGVERLDLAILNAATGWFGPAEEEAPRSVVRQIDVNLTAPVHFAQVLAPRLFAARGRLLVVGSRAAVKGAARFATYAATKAALDGLTRALREEWRGRAAVSIVHPGPVRTAMHAKAGLKLGLSRGFFVSPASAARSIERVARDGERKRLPGRWYGRRRWFFGRARENEL